MLRHLFCWLSHLNGHRYRTHYTFDDPPFMPYRVCANCGKSKG